MALENILENQYISTSLAVFLVLYGGLAAPKLPDNVANLFSSPIFRLLVIFLIAYTSSKNHSIALVATVVLVLLMHDSNNKEVKEEPTKVITIDEKTHKIIAKHKFQMDEEENGESEVIHILKDKTTLTESQIVNSIIDQEINKLQNEVSVENKDSGSVEVVSTSETASVSAEVNTEVNTEVTTEVNTEVTTDVVGETSDVPMPNDVKQCNYASGVEDNNITKFLGNDVLKPTNVRSTRGLEGSSSCEGKPCEKCSTCNSFGKDNYKIDTDDNVLPFDGNGHFNFNNM